MGPYCNYCGRRCFIRITAEWPTHIAGAYNEHFGHISVLAATCPDGQAVEKRLIGWCYDDARAQMDPMFSAARLVLQKILRERGALEEILAHIDYTNDELMAANRIIRSATMNLLGAIEELVGEIPAAPQMRWQMFTKEAGKEAKECFEEIMKAFPKKKAAEFFGHFNEVAIFIDDARRAAPDVEAKKS